jgi:hypothetical protein
MLRATEYNLPFTFISRQSSVQYFRTKKGTCQAPSIFWHN